MATEFFPLALVEVPLNIIINFLLVLVALETLLLELFELLSPLEREPELF